MKKRDHNILTQDNKQLAKRLKRQDLQRPGGADVSARQPALRNG